MSVARAVQRIRPHVPLIKFRFVKGTVGPSVGASVGASKLKSNSSTTKTSIRRGESIELTLLPAKYRRAALSLDEIDQINRGGPE